MPFTRADLSDADFLDAPELLADGSTLTPFRSITGLLSINAGSSQVTVPSTELLTLNRDAPIEAGDLVVISGATAGNGSYTITAIISEQVFEVTPAPSGTGSGGTASFYYPAAATRIGVNPSGRTNFSANTLQGALNQLDAAITGGGGSGVTSIDFLLENEPPAPSNNYSNIISGALVTQEDWRRADTTLIKRNSYTYTSGRVTSETRNVYAANGTTIIGQLTVAYTYSGGRVASSVRTRVI